MKDEGVVMRGRGCVDQQIFTMKMVVEKFHELVKKLFEKGYDRLDREGLLYVLRTIEVPYL